MYHKIIKSRIKWVEDPTSHSLMQSIVNRQNALIDYDFALVTYSSITCGKFKNARLKKSRKKFFLSEFGMAFRKGFDEDFKRKINEL